MQGVSRAVKTRAYAATAILTAMLAGVAYKAWGLQVDDAAEFRARAMKQHVHVVEIPAPRGEIVDARNRALAVSADVDSVYANPREVVDVTETAARLAEALGLDAAIVEPKLSTAKGFVWILRHVTPEQAAAVKAAKLAGIDVTTEPARWYPGKTSGGPVIGFAGVDGNGLDGLELRFDKLLTGQRATFSALRDARGKTALADGVVDAVPGANVQLTIDRAIQAFADQELAAAIETQKAKAGTVIIEDVQTGAILAMASWPTYDPNEPGNLVETKARNRAVTDVFEIGSIMKVFTLAAAFDAKTSRPDEWWDVEHGRWQPSFARKPIRDEHHDELLTTAGILKRSSNVGAAKLGLELGAMRLYTALKRFGFGARTGIELPHEEPGTVRNGARWRDIELATISFGYGLTVTPLQVAAGMAAVGAGGVWHTPHLIARITDADGKVVYEPTVEARQIMEPRTASWMLPILASVFDKPDKHGKNGGTAGSVDVDGFRAGGKTATAHKIDPATHRYAEKMYVSSFAGLAPIDHPRIAIVVVIDEPGGDQHFGGQVAGPVFAKLVSETLRYLGVPGDKPAIDEDAPVAPPPPVADEEDVVPVDEIALPDGVPDFRGMSIARVLAEAKQAGVAVEVVGSGRAVSQDAIAGGGVRVTFDDSPGIPQ
jgi:cell division protein FtsI (penicillin-binding protein 3)